MKVNNSPVPKIPSHFVSIKRPHITERSRETQRLSTHTVRRPTDRSDVGRDVIYRQSGAVGICPKAVIENRNSDGIAVGGGTRRLVVEILMRRSETQDAGSESQCSAAFTRTPGDDDRVCVRRIQVGECGIDCGCIVLINRRLDTQTCHDRAEVEVSREKVLASSAVLAGNTKLVSCARSETEGDDGFVAPIKTLHTGRNKGRARVVKQINPWVERIDRLAGLVSWRACL